MTKIYLVRHCEAQGNVDKVFQGHLDGVVTDNGRHQLDLLSERFRDVGLDAIYTSPLIRARETANAIGRYHEGLPIIVEDGLIEINGGRLEGMKRDSMLKNFREITMAWCFEPHKFCAPDGESMRQVYDRVYDAVLRIAKANEGRTVALASHGCSIRNFLCRAKGLPLEELDSVGWSDNTGVNMVEYDNGGWNILFENDISHFDEGMLRSAGKSWFKKENFKE